MVKMEKLSTGSRSGKMRRYWSYMRQIQKVYYPDKNIAWIRKQFSKKNRGLKNKVDDVAWQNPSP